MKEIILNKEKLESIYNSENLTEAQIEVDEYLLPIYERDNFASKSNPLVYQVSIKSSSSLNVQDINGTEFAVNVNLTRFYDIGIFLNEVVDIAPVSPPKLTISPPCKLNPGRQKPSDILWRLRLRAPEWKTSRIQTLAENFLTYINQTHELISLDIENKPQLRFSGRILGQVSAMVKRSHRGKLDVKKGVYFQMNGDHELILRVYVTESGQFICFKELRAIDKNCAVLERSNDFVVLQSFSGCSEWFGHDFLSQKLFTAIGLESYVTID